MSGLTALEAYPQFIVCRFVPRPDGRTDKIPCTPTGSPGDAHSPGNWLTRQDAQQRAARLGADYGVGFVLTTLDPFFFIDVDACLQEGGQWSPTATGLCEYFRGAAVEVSQSGRGLHIIGTYSTLPAHSCKGPGFDLYTSRRFVALTWSGVIGDAATDHTAALGALIAQHLPSVAEISLAWTDEPVPEWSGPTDDTELLRRMLRSRSGASVFGNKASFRDLWTADADVLGECYPHDQGTQPFDHSAADAALCSHLAFWTGKNAVRMDRLFRESALYRDKWERRPDYRERTVLGAIAHCRDVYQERRPETPETPEAPAGPPAASNGSFVHLDQQPEYFAGCVYIRDRHRVFVPDGALIKQESFNATYGGNAFGLDPDGTKTTRSAFEAFTQSSIRYPFAHSICFRPEIPPGSVITEDGRPVLNTYTPIDVPSTPGDVSPFLDLLSRLLPDPRDRAILCAYLAAVVQYPGVKFQWAPLLQGTEGNGKTAIMTAVSGAIGRKYVHFPNPRELDGKFNGWLDQKLFIGVEEIKVKDRWEVMEALKPMITNLYIEIQAKGLDQVVGDNRANFLFCSNHKDAILKGRSDRRYCVFFTAQQEKEHIARDGMGGAYFPRFYSWLRGEGRAHVTHWLRSYPIPDEFNPAGACHRAPDTSSTEAAIQASLGPVEQEVTSAIEEGRPGFRGGFVSSIALDRLLDKMKGRGVSRNKRRGILQTIGYDYHPALAQGRAPRATAMDEGRPRLYVLKSGPLWTLDMTPAEIVAQYESAQQQEV